MENEEIWRPIVGFEGLYEISNFGNIKSIRRTVVGKDGKKHTNKGGLLNLSADNTGYVRATLLNNGKSYRFLVHRLVAITFPEICGEWFEGAVVNHKNRITYDNRADNLEFGSILHNNTYSPTMEQRIKTIVKNGKRRKPVAKIDPETKEQIEVYSSVSECADKNNISKGNLCCLLKGRYGYRSIKGFFYAYI